MPLEVVCMGVKKLGVSITQLLVDVLDGLCTERYSRKLGEKHHVFLSV